jgi:PAS domain S-box-containing protein
MSFNQLFRKSATSRMNLHAKSQILENRLSIATGYLEKIAEGNFTLDLRHDDHLQDDAAASFNNTLIRLRDKLLQYAEKDQQRLWAAEGLSKFMNLIKGDTHAQTNFYDKILSFLINYLNANQGGIFLLNDADPQAVYLELTACYAYSKKKYLDKRIEVGQGLVGQCFLEKETAIFTNLPKDYIQITSGLGESTPAFLLIVPLKFNDDVLGVIEIASFDKLESYQVEVVEKIMESLASVSINIRNAKRVDLLLQEAEVKAKKLQEQEENLKQNIEELQSTQEEMVRNEAELARQSNLLKFIIDSIPFPIFVKDELGRYTIVNRAEARLFNLQDKELIGKDDRYLVSDEAEWKVIQESDMKVLASDEPIELPLQSFSTVNGTRYIFKTTKIPFVNEVTGKKNILGVSIDLTEKLQLEKKLYQEQLVSSQNTLINIVGRQRMLSQKIGFYCQTLARGKRQFAPLLEKAIALHEHSLTVIEFGGIPNGLTTVEIIAAADESLHGNIEGIKQIWNGYQAAAYKILSLTNEDSVHIAREKNTELEAQLCFIEDNSETLLQANDALMQACLAINLEKIADVY